MNKRKARKLEIKELRSQGVKVYTKNSYRWWGLLGDTVAFGLPIAFIAIEYDLFKGTNWYLRLTGWAYAVIIFIVLFLKEQISKKLEEVDVYLEKMGKRIKNLSIFIVVLVVLLMSKLFIDKLIVLLLIITVSYLAAFLPYKKYDANKQVYDTLKAKKKKEEEEKLYEDNKIVVM